MSGSKDADREFREASPHMTNVGRQGDPGDEAPVKPEEFADFSPSTIYFDEIGPPKPELDGANPKEAWGDKKTPAGCINPLVLLEEAHLMRSGAYKYGFANYAITKLSATNYVTSMAYLHAMMRHYLLWSGGEDNDPDSGVSHLAAIRSCCAILRTQQINGTLIDDRPEWGDVRVMLDELEKLWLDTVPKLDEQIKAMEK